MSQVPAHMLAAAVKPLTVAEESGCREIVSHGYTGFGGELARRIFATIDAERARADAADRVALAAGDDVVTERRRAEAAEKERDELKRQAAALLEQARLFERCLAYDIRGAERSGDDEGANLKNFTGLLLLAVIDAAEGRSSALASPGEPR